MTDTVFGVPIRATEMMQFVWMLGWVPLTAFLYWLLKRLFGVVLATGDRLWPNREWRWGATLFVIAMLVWPWWGVVTLSIEADRLCREHAGLHVYKTIEVEGVRTNLGIEWAAARGFKYVENSD